MPIGDRDNPVPPSHRELALLRHATDAVVELGIDGRLLYVGKATSLKARVNSYFRKRTGVSPRLLEMLSQARDIAVEPTASPRKRMVRPRMLEACVTRPAGSTA